MKRLHIPTRLRYVTPHKAVILTVTSPIILYDTQMQNIFLHRFAVQVVKCADKWINVGRWKLHTKLWHNGNTKK